MNSYECPRCKGLHGETRFGGEDPQTIICGNCGFDFYLEVEWVPDYSTYCVTHEFGEYGKPSVEGRHSCSCKHCGLVRFKWVNDE